MASIIEKLVALLSFEVDDASAKEAKSAIDKVGKSFKDFAIFGTIASAAVNSAFGLMVNDFAQVADETNKLARRVGATAEAIQELDYVAERSGVSINLMRNSIEKLNAKASQAMSGATEMQKVFGELGLSSERIARADPGEQMTLIAEAMQRLPSDADRTRLAMKLFEEEGRAMVTVFEGGSEAIATMREEARKLGLFSSEDAARAEEYNDRLLDAQMAFKGIKNLVGAALLPSLTDLLVKFRDFFIQNREFIASGIVGAVEGLGHALRIAGVMAGIFLQYKIGSAVLSIAAAFRTFGNAALIAQLKALLIPIAIGAAITAIVAIGESIYTWFKSGGKADTAFGDFVDMISDTTAFKSVKKLIDTIVDSVKALVGWIGDATAALKEFFGTRDAGSLPTASLEDARMRIAQGPALGAAYAAQYGILPTAAQIASTTNNSSQVVNDNRQITINGADMAAVRKELQQDYSYAAKVGDTGIER